MAFAFDTLAFAKRLRDAGIPPPEAEAHAEAAREFIMAELVTKSDLFGNTSSLRQDMERWKQEVERWKQEVERWKQDVEHWKQDMLASEAALRRDFKAEMETLSLRLTVRLGIMLAAGLSVSTAILGLLMRFH